MLAAMTASPSPSRSASVTDSDTGPNRLPPEKPVYLGKQAIFHSLRRKLPTTGPELPSGSLTNITRKTRSRFMGRENADTHREAERFQVSGGSGLK